jgi:hypothetical protein
MYPAGARTTNLRGTYDLRSYKSLPSVGVRLFSMYWTPIFVMVDAYQNTEDQKQ